MSVGRLAAAGVAVSLFAAAAGAQQPAPGTLEVGGYGQYSIFDEDIFGDDNAFGGGARVGFFLSPRWAIEGEGSYSKTDRGVADDAVDKYSPVALRLNYNCPFAGSSAFVLGGGLTRSDYGTSFHYGPSALAGVRVGFGRVALRVDGVYNNLPGGDEAFSEFYVRGGLSALIPGSTPMSAEEQAQMGGAPQPGTLELGLFGQYSIFDDDMNLDNAIGFGGRIGGFVTPMIEPEVDFSYTEADQDPSGPTGLHVTPIAARLNFNFPFGARNAFILGGGATRTFFQSPGQPYYRGVDEDNSAVGGSYNWGVSGLAGVRVGLGQRVALRVDGLADYLPEPKFANFGLRAGLSLLLGGARPAEPVVVAAVDTTPVAPVDTTPVQPAVDSAAILAEQQRQQQEAARSALTAVIYFDFDRSNIRPDAASTLDAKMPYLQANPGMRIRITGHTDARGSDEYNLALGQRRAASARRYLTQRGIDAGRIEITSRGEEAPVVPNATTEAEHQQNRRDEFEIVIGGENITIPTGAGGAVTSPATEPMPDTTQARDTTAAPSLAPAAPDTLRPDTLTSRTAPGTEPTQPDTTATPAAPATPDTTGTPTTPTPAPTTPPTTPTPTTPDTTGTPGTPPTTPTDTTRIPPSTPPSTPPLR